MISIAQDVTGQKKFEKSLKDSELKYRQLLNNAGVGIGFWKPDGTLLLFNHQAADFIGGKPEDAGQCLKRIQKTVSEQKPLRFHEDKMSPPRGGGGFHPSIPAFITTRMK